MTKPLEAPFYFSGVIDYNGECQQVSDDEAQFWTVYERNSDGLSSAICDCYHRDDAVAATERFNALIAALEQSQKSFKRLDERNAVLNSTLDRWAVERAENANVIVEMLKALENHEIFWSIRELELGSLSPEAAMVRDVGVRAIRTAGGTVQGDE